MAATYFDSVEDSVTGKPVKGATVEVLSDALAYVTIYSDDGVTPVNQATAPVTTDETGFFRFWTNEQTVTIRISYDGEVKRLIEGVNVFDPEVGPDLTAYGVPAADYGSVQDAINYAASIAPCAVRLTGVTNLTAGITIPDGVTLIGPGTLRATAAMGTLVTPQTGSAIKNVILDANGLATYAYRATDASNFKLDEVTIRNWINGVLVENANHAGVDAYESSDISITRLRTEDPASNCVYAFRFASKRGKHIHRVLIDDVVIEGVPAAWTQAYGSADQVSMQGIRDSILNNVRSLNGGELGFAIVRMSRDVIVANCIAKGADADGFLAGGGAIHLQVDSATGWQVGDGVVGATSGATCVIEWINGTDVFVGSTVRDFEVGETVENTIQMTLSSVDGLAVGDTITGVSSGATGTLVRIVDPDNPRAPKKLFIKDAGAGDVDFTPTGEDVTNGTVTRTMVSTVRNPAITTTTQHTLSGVIKTDNITFSNCLSLSNGYDRLASSLTMTLRPELWAAGETITGATSGATATLTGIDAYRAYYTGLTGTFVAGENVSNGTDTYVCNYPGGLYAGFKIQHASNVRIDGGAAYDPNGNQIYGVYAVNSPNLLISGNTRLTGNLVGETLILSGSTLTPSRVRSNLTIDGLLAMPRGTLATIASGVIGIEGSNTLVDVEGGSGGGLTTDDLVTINRADGETIEDGTVVFLKAASSDRSVVVKATGGNIAMTSDFTLDHVRDSLALIYHGGPARWVRLNSDNAT